MRAQYSKNLSAVLIELMFVVTISFVPSAYLNANDSNNNLSSSTITNDDLSLPENQQTMIDEYFLAEGASSNQGVLNPVEIEQSGYAASENISARTDSYQNLHYDLPLDTAHEWIADEAEVSLWNLEKLYAVNGTFDEGIPGYTVSPAGPLDYYPLGWNATSESGDIDQAQQVSYEQGGTRYVTAQNTAKLTNLGQNQYTHFAGTNVTWFQTFENAPYTDQFLLQYSYLLLQGPLNSSFSGKYALKIFIDNEIVSDIDLPTLSNRGTWFDSGVIPVTIGSPSDFLTLKIGIVINSTFVTDADLDYDSDGSPDGAINTQFITVYLDDISLIKATPPTPEQVQLEFSTGGEVDALTGSPGDYTASIVNASYWISNPVSVALSSNTSVSFDYKTRLLSHRFTESKWEPNIASTGVSYSVEHGNSSQLTLYSYVGYLGDYEEPKMTIVYPHDWENVTVSDPFLTPQTGDCIIGDGIIIIPSSVIGYLGWWEVRFESPNYAKSIGVQKYNSVIPEWNDDTIFRIGNSTRTQVNISSATTIPSIVNNVNVTWFFPNGSEWTAESLSGGVDGQVNGSSHLLLSGASPAGEWYVDVLWSNGTEVACGYTTFEVHHSSNLVGDPEIVETDAGQVITAVVRYSDGDTGSYITDDLTTISGNWSASTKYFIAITENNWWQVSLDTSEIGAGNFIVHVDASRPYYDPASCDILIISTNVTRLNSPNAPWTSAQWGSEISLTFNFEVYDAGTDTWGPVTNNSDISASLNWTAGYWNVVEDATPGIYLVNVDTSAQPSGTYLLNATFEKPDHESKDLLLALIVSPIASSLVVLGDTSARVNISDDYSLKMKFMDQSEVPIPSASVVVDSVTPPVGLAHTTVDEVSGEPGNYSVTLTPSAAGVFAIRFVATESNSEPASTVFVLVVNDVETMLDVPGGSSFEIGLTDVFNTTFTYKTADYTGIENSSISIIYSGNTGGISWELAEHSLGEYSVEFSATLSGTYVVTIAAFKQYYQSASDSFFLVVRDITTNFTLMNGTAGIVSYGQDYRMVLSYTNGTDWGLDGADISIENVVPETGLSWGSTLPGDSGIYSILLTPTISNTFTVLVKASLLNHQVQFVRFTITATAIASSLTVLNSSTSIAFDQSFTVFVHYQSEDSTGLENANLSIQNPPAEISYTSFEDLDDGYYRVTLTPQSIGIFDLVFRAELTGYQSDTAGFALSASRIQTDLRFVSGLTSDIVEYLQTSEFVVIFERTDFNQTIEGADISLLASPTTGFEWTYHEDSGMYHIEVEPGHVGRWTLTISASKLGHALGSVQFIIDVEPVSIVAKLLSSPSATEGQDFPIEIKLSHEGDDTPVTGALVEYRMTADGSPVGNFEPMIETTTTGVYYVRYTFPLYLSTTNYQLEIRVSKDNYALVGESFTTNYAKANNDFLRATPFIIGSGIFLVALIGSVIGVRVYNTRKRRKNLEALQVKKRFDDVSNILGIITLHKKTGLPVYSKMIKGGFEEAMISAFITAITHFRSEFEMDEKHWEFNVIPISDIISAVPTRSLIVAFITIRPPSKYQASAMEAFGRATGALYDEILADTKVGFVDPSQTDIFDTLFYDLLDGILIERFRTTKDATFPKSMQCLVTAAQELENGEGFKLEDLAMGIATCGVEETHAYKIVMDAIDDNLIEMAPETDSEIVPPPPAESVVHELDDEEDEFSI